MSSTEKGIVALSLEDNVRSLVMVAAAYKHYSWYCKVHVEIEGELSDEANVADPCKGVVSFESTMFEKRDPLRLDIDAQCASTEEKELTL
ncbi:hypothetical protein Tco_0986367 [Tanacetum coccineum]